MAIRPTRGSGIGQVSPFSVLDRGTDASSLLGAGVNPRRSGIRQAIDLSGQNNKILPRNFSLTDVSPVPGSVGMSEVPSTGLPNLDTAQSGVQRGVLGLDMTAIDDNPFSISAPMPSDDVNRVASLFGITPRGRESLDEFLGMLSIAPRPGGPAQVRDAKAAARAQGLDPDAGPGGLDFDMPEMDAFKAFMDYDPSKDAGFAASIRDAQRDVMSQDSMNTMAQRSKNMSDSYLNAEEGAASGSGAGGDGTSTTDADGNALDAVDYDSVSQFPTDSGGQTTEQKKSSLYAGLLKESLDNYNKLVDNAPSGAKTMEEYKKEFSDATGIDITGQPDNSAALTAFGLALMQNKAGKGFDVGELLSETGKAGEKALPLMAQARKEAREAQIAAGQYALGATKEDKAARAKSLDEATKYLVGRRDKILDDQRARIEAMDDFDKKRLATIELETLKAGFDAEIEIQKLLAEANEPNFKVGNVKDWKPLDNKDNVILSMGIKEKDGRPVFLFPAEQATTLGEALADVVDGLNGMDSLRDKIIDASRTPAGEFAGISGQKAYEVYQQWAASLGYEAGKVPQFDKDGKFTGELKREMPIQEADAIRERVIAQFKRFLTQETGNGISNVDIQKIDNLLGKINFLTDPQGALNRIEEVRNIFLKAESKLTSTIKMMDNKDRYQTPEEYDLARKAISDGINRAYYKKGTISGGGAGDRFDFTVDTDGNQVYDFTQ